MSQVDGTREVKTLRNTEGGICISITLSNPQTTAQPQSSPIKSLTMSNNPFGGPSSSLTNNPFAFQIDPNHASNRYPKIDDSTLPSGHLGAGSSTIGGGQWGQSSLAGGYNPQQQYPQKTGFPQNGQFFSSSFQQPYTSSPQASFQSSSTFGQQQFQPQLPGNQASAQFQTSNPVYQDVAALDPYANLALLPQALPNPAHKPPSSPTTESFGGTSFHSDHPRSFVRDHKSDLEKWDPQSWKQFMQSIDKLKDAWVARKDVVNRAIAGYNHQWTQQDFTRAQDVRALFHDIFRFFPFLLPIIVLSFSARLIPTPISPQRRNFNWKKPIPATVTPLTHFPVLECAKPSMQVSILFLNGLKSFRRVQE